jgi:ATP-dependent RNA helicase DDX35
MQATFWKPGAANPSAQAGLDRTGAATAQPAAAPHVHNKHRHLSLREQQGRLPIAAHRQELLYALERHRVVIIAGETGCGKSTQVPRYLHEAGWTVGGRSVLCTQPRGLSVMATAARVADELGETRIGRLVGFSTMHDNRTSAHTRLRFCTDRYLVRELMSSPLLLNCSVVMIDEAHERHPHTDLLLGLFRKLLSIRDDLRLIVASATLDVPLFVNFFKHLGHASAEPAGARALHEDSALRDVVAMSVGKRQHAIDTQFLTLPCTDYLVEAVKTVVKIHEAEKPGAILVFVADRSDVEMVVRELQNWDDSGGSASGGAAYTSSLAAAAAVMGASRYRLAALPLHAGLSSREQIAALRPARAGERKVVVATGIAESSITIDDIVYVVDSCFDRIRTYDSSTGLGAIVTCPVSQASAKQRAGRAGRTRPGKCFRLTTLDAYRGLRTSSIPAIRRSDLTEIVLQLKALGVEDVLHFAFLSPPPVSALAHSLEMLYALGALDEHCRLTRHGGLSLLSANGTNALGVLRGWMHGGYTLACGNALIILCVCTLPHSDTKPRKRRYSSRVCYARRRSHDAGRYSVRL